jgi:CubicO group peptidase (beta-lactamase class C family)
MKMRSLIFKSMATGAVLTLALFAGRRARRRSFQDEIPHGDAFEKINAHIERQMERQNIPGAALAIVEEDEIAHLRGFGRARPGGEAPTPHTPFIIGSLTKSITALAVMQLVEDGKIELHAPVQRYLPWFRVASPRASAQITVRHLLHQTSGLPQLSGLRPLTDFDGSPGASGRQARALSTLELARPVGSAWEYCNMNYNLLGLINEAASGETYEAYVQNHIFAPLEMIHTYASQAEAKQNGMAVGHRFWFAVPFAEPDLPLPRGSLAAGELSSPAPKIWPIT